jgi:hypothetical protein
MVPEVQKVVLYATVREGQIKEVNRVDRRVDCPGPAGILQTGAAFPTIVSGPGVLPLAEASFLFAFGMFAFPLLCFRFLARILKKLNEGFGGFG